MSNLASREVPYIKEFRIIDKTTGEINPEHIDVQIIKDTYTKSKFDELTYKERNPDGISFFHLKLISEQDIQKELDLNLIDLGRLMMLFSYASYDNNGRHYLRLDNGRPIKYKIIKDILKINTRSLRTTMNNFLNKKILFFDEDKQQYYFTDKYISKGKMDYKEKRKKLLPPYRFYTEAIRELYNALAEDKSNQVKLLGLLLCITPYIRLLDQVGIKYKRNSSNNMLVLSEYDEINERYEAISQKMLGERLKIAEKTLITHFKKLNEITYKTTGQHLIYKYNESLQAYGQRYKYTNEAIVINPRYTYSSDEHSKRYRNLVNAIENADSNVISFLNKDDEKNSVEEVKNN